LFFLRIIHWSDHSWTWRRSENLCALGLSLNCWLALTILSNFGLKKNCESEKFNSSLCNPCLTKTSPKNYGYLYYFDSGVFMKNNRNFRFWPRYSLVGKLLCMSFKASSRPNLFYQSVLFLNEMTLVQLFSFWIIILLRAPLHPFQMISSLSICERNKKYTGFSSWYFGSDSSKWWGKKYLGLKIKKIKIYKKIKSCKNYKNYKVSFNQIPSTVINCDIECHNSDTVKGDQQTMSENIFS